ncbi:hypothetical protein MKX01_027353 [Papaver californicum]|nr:hypothetical protein MKX01_027353 [Papaver californicum]
MGRDKSRTKPRNSSDNDDVDNDSRGMKEITDEDINEYLIKKAQKKAMKVAKKLKNETVSGYANDSNPFGDPNLNQNFVWQKKIECRVGQGLPVDGISVKLERKMRKERMVEIEKVKKRREGRAMEKAQHEEEMAFLKEFHFNLLRKDLQFLQNPVKSNNSLKVEHDNPKPQAEEEIARDVEDV